MRLIDEIRISFTKAEGLFRLMIINVVVFLLIALARMVLFLAGTPDMMVLEVIDVLAAKSDLSILAEQPWSVFTYMFVHEKFLHILFNMLILYWSGKLFCEYLGSKKMVAVYILGGISGAVLYVLAYNIFPVFRDAVALSRLIGASAGVIAVLVAIATLLPNYPMHLLFFGAVRLKFIAGFLVILYLISIPEGNAGGDISHLGGAIMGFVYTRSLKAGVNLGAWFEWISDSVTRMFRPTGKFKVVHKRSSSRSRRDMEPRQEVIDEILDKISRSGYSSLTREEKEILFSASKTPGKES